MKSAVLQYSGVLTQEERHQSDVREATIAHQSQKGFNSIAKQTEVHRCTEKEIIHR